MRMLTDRTAKAVAGRANGRPVSFFGLFDLPFLLLATGIWMYRLYMLSCSMLTSSPMVWSPLDPGPRHNVPPLGYARLLAFPVCLYSRT